MSAFIVICLKISLWTPFFNEPEARRKLPLPASSAKRAKARSPNRKQAFMPQSPSELIASGIDSIKLDILVFGPQVQQLSPDPWTNAVQTKRIEIKSSLEAEGHNAKYAEEVVDPNVNAFIQEIFLMKEYDLIINLIGSPGANIELGAIASKTEIANRCQLFLDSNHVGGLAGPACEHATTLGAFVQHYSYPADLTECHLLGAVMNRVRTAQTQKYFA